MKNVSMKVENGKLVITVDLSKEFGLSASGKSTTIATTEGNAKLESGVVVGLNVYKPRG